MGLIFLFKKKEQQKPQMTVTISTHEYTPNELKQHQEEKVSKIKKLAQSAIPSKNGLRPHEIAMLSHAIHYKTSGNDFPRYWRFDYGIDDPQAVLDMLLSRGFIRVTTAKENIDRLKVSELKEILSEHGIKSVGKKDDLVVSVQENINEADLIGKIPVTKYAITELGAQELKENEYVSYFDGSSRYGLTVWDMNKLLEGYPHKLFKDKIWYTFNKELHELEEKLSVGGNIFEFYKQKSFIHYEMCEFLVEENQHMEDAIKLWADALYYSSRIDAVFSFKVKLKSEVGRTEPGKNRIKDPETGESKIVEDNSHPTFRDSLNLEYKVKTISKIKEETGFSNEDIRKFLTAGFSECSIQYELLAGWSITRLTLTDEELADLVIAELEGDYKAANYIYEEIEQEIKNDKVSTF